MPPICFWTVYTSVSARCGCGLGLASPNSSWKSSLGGSSGGFANTPIHPLLCFNPRRLIPHMHKERWTGKVHGTLYIVFCFLSRGYFLYCFSVFSKVFNISFFFTSGASTKNWKYCFTHMLLSDLCPTYAMTPVSRKVSRSSLGSSTTMMYCTTRSLSPYCTSLRYL